MPIPMKPVMAPALLPAAVFIASACAATSVAPAMFGFVRAAFRCIVLIISASSSGNVTEPKAMLTICNPLVAAHFWESASFIAFSSSVLCEMIWFGRISRADNLASAG